MEMRIDMDFTQWNEQLRGSQERTGNLQPVHERIGEFMAAEAKKNIEDGGADANWDPLKPETLRARERQHPGSGQRPLIVTRELINSIDKDANGQRVDVGSALPKARTQFYGRGNIPARSPFGWRGGVLDRVGDAYLDWIVKGSL